VSVALWLLGLALLAWPTHPPPGGWWRRRSVVDDRTLPGVLDLLAVGLRAGAAPGPALVAAAAAADPALRTVLVDVGGHLSLGVEPGRAWAAAGATPTLAAVAVLAERSGASGARLADSLTATALTLREDALASGRRAAARVGVWTVLPLGLCFLPAFVLLGVVPAVVGLLAGTGVAAP
jgi:pilus assembly protein TadC